MSAEIPAELLATVEVHSTWQSPIGALWIVDHQIDDKKVMMRPDFRTPNWSGTLYDYKMMEVTKEYLIYKWRKIETTGQHMDRIQYQRKVDCQLGRHEDPDNSGMCIKCGLVFDDE